MPSAPRPDQPLKPRLTWVDRAKGICSVYVVVGHVVGGLLASKVLTASEFWTSLRLWEYGFNMPALFLLLGLYLNRSLDKGLGLWIQRRARTLLYPFALWSILYWVMGQVMYQYANNPVRPSFPYSIIYDPRAGMWTLATLFVCAVGYGVLRKAQVPSWAVVVLCFAGTLYERSAFDTHDKLTVLTHVCWYGFWLTLGASIAHRLVAIEQRLSSWELLAFGLLAYGASVAVHLFDWTVVRELAGGPVLAGHARLFLHAAWGACGTLCLGAWIGRTGNGPIARLLEYTGRHSLEVYMMSSIGMVCARLLLLTFLGIRNEWVLLGAGTAAGLALPLVTVAVLDRLGIGYIFRFEPNTTRRLAERRMRSSVVGETVAG